MVDNRSCHRCYAVQTLHDWESARYLAPVIPCRAQKDASTGKIESEENTAASTQPDERSLSAGTMNKDDIFRLTDRGRLAIKHSPSLASFRVGRNFNCFMRISTFRKYHAMSE